MKEKRTAQLQYAAMRAVDEQLEQMGFDRPARAATCQRVEDGGLRVVVLLDQELEDELVKDWA